MKPQAGQFVRTFTVSTASRSADIEVRSLPGRDGVEFYAGWPKDLLPEPLRLLVQSSPYWGLSVVAEDDERYWYWLTWEPDADDEETAKRIERRIQFMWKQGQKAFATAKRWAEMDSDD